MRLFKEWKKLPDVSYSPFWDDQHRVYLYIFWWGPFFTNDNNNKNASRISFSYKLYDMLFCNGRRWTIVVNLESLLGYWGKSIVVFCWYLGKFTRFCFKMYFCCSWWLFIYFCLTIWWLLNWTELCFWVFPVFFNLI